MKYHKFRYAGTTCHLFIAESQDRVNLSFGDIPGRRETLRSIKGKPNIDEILNYVGNVSFFIPKDPNSEAIIRHDFVGISVQNNTLIINQKSPITAGHAVVQSGKYSSSYPEEFHYIRLENPRKLLGSSYKGISFALACEGRRLLERGLRFADYQSLIPILEQYLGDRVLTLVNADGGGSTGDKVMDTLITKAYDGRTLGTFMEIYTPVTLQMVPVLRINSKGVFQEFLQRRLTHLGYGLNNDGHFGNLTFEAVKRFQSAHGLKVDGIVGQQTWGVLLK